jgi:hypothetical protein
MGTIQPNPVRRATGACIPQKPAVPATPGGHLRRGAAPRPAATCAGVPVEVRNSPHASVIQDRGAVGARNRASGRLPERDSGSWRPAEWSTEPFPVDTNHSREEYPRGAAAGPRPGKNRLPGPAGPRPARRRRRPSPAREAPPPAPPAPGPRGAAAGPRPGKNRLPGPAGPPRPARRRPRPRRPPAREAPPPALPGPRGAAPGPAGPRPARCRPRPRLAAAPGRHRRRPWSHGPPRSAWIDLTAPCIYAACR